ncbi:MAG: hypothetical protein ThorAB25_17610 [Candidatus Thorarchaeota archaeon AB_25]|nr:MAG: hypothetical protein ThorAB25_17610 [Candidatus Thorarchaeota archaeon AB_25]
MFRTITALLVCLVTAVIIGAFQIVGLDIPTIQAIIGGGDITNQLMAIGALLFGGLLFPYTLATVSAIYSPLVALGVAGFIAGLISKSGVRMLFVSIFAMVLFFLGYYVLTLTGNPTDVTDMLNIARNIAIDLGVAFGLLFIPGIIGASLTSEDY